MNIKVVLLVSVIVLAGIIKSILVYFRYKRFKHLFQISDENLKLLKEEIDKGILMEDEFVTTYFDLLRNEGYMHVFGGYEKQTHNLLYQMINESKNHKQALVDIKKSLKI